VATRANDVAVTSPEFVGTATIARPSDSTKTSARDH